MMMSGFGFLDQSFRVVHEIGEATAEATSLDIAGIKAMVAGILAVDQVRSLVVHYDRDLPPGLHQAAGQIGDQCGLARSKEPSDDRDSSLHLPLHLPNRAP
jgi:hypothetical protein